MGDVGYPGISNDLIYSNMLGLRSNIVLPSSIGIEAVKNASNKRTIRLLKKRKFRNIEYV